jgi:hypothetical protein
MLRRIALVVVLCLVAGALVPPSHWGAGDRRDGRQIPGVARQGSIGEIRGSRRNGDAGSPRIDSAVRLRDRGGRSLCSADVARRMNWPRSVATLPSYFLATHLSL